MRRMEMNTINLKNFVVQFQDPVLLAQDGLNVNNNSGQSANVRLTCDVRAHLPLSVQSWPFARRNSRLRNRFVAEMLKLCVFHIDAIAIHTPNQIS